MGQSTAYNTVLQLVLPVLQHGLVRATTLTFRFTVARRHNHHAKTWALRENCVQRFNLAQLNTEELSTTKKKKSSRWSFFCMIDC